MKKLLFCLIVGFVVALPLSASAWKRSQMAKPIFGVDCSTFNQDNGYGEEDRCSTTVYVFDDANNKCYVVKGSNANGISCLRN